MALVERVIINGGGWAAGMDFYYAMFDALGSPTWHGASIDSLIDSIVWGDINLKKPPYDIEIRGLESVSPIVCEEITHFISAFKRAKEEFFERNAEVLAVNIRTAPLTTRWTE